MSSTAIRNAVLAVVLLAVGIGGGYLGARALDDDRSPTTTGDTTTTAPPDGSTTGATGSAPAGQAAVTISPLGVLGWWSDGAWVRADAGSPPIRGGERYTLVGLEGELGSAVGGALDVTCEISEPYPPHVELDPPFPRSGEVGVAAVAVTGVADPTPRPVEALDRRSDTYRTAAGEALATVDIDDHRPEITQLYRADLDGDGSDEVLITVARVHGDDLVEAEPGDYSAVIVRRVVGGQVRSQVVAHDATQRVEEGFPFLLLHRIVAVADLNGDGSMELVLGDRYYEGEAVRAFADDGTGRLAEVIGAGCGA